MGRNPSTPARPLFPEGYRIWTTANTIPAGRHHHTSPPRGQSPRGNSTARRIMSAARIATRSATRTPISPESPTLARRDEPIVSDMAWAPVFFAEPATIVREPSPAPLSPTEPEPPISPERPDEESTHEELMQEMRNFVARGEVPVHQPLLVTRNLAADDHFAHLEQHTEICYATPPETENADDYFSNHEHQAEIQEASSISITPGRPTSIYEPDGPTEVLEASTVSYTAAGRPVSVMSRALTPSQEELYRRATAYFSGRHSVSHQHTIPRRPIPKTPTTPEIPARSAARGSFYRPALNRRSTTPSMLPPRPGAPTPLASTRRIPPPRPARPISFGRPGGQLMEVALDPALRTSLYSDIEEMQAIAANTFF